VSIPRPSESETRIWLLLPESSRGRGLFEALRPWEVDVRIHSRVPEFERSFEPDVPSAVLVHDELPERAAYRLCERFGRGTSGPSFVLHQAQPDTRRTVWAMKHGATACVEATTPAPEVARVLAEALEEDRQRRARQVRTAEFGTRLDSLTRRQQEILDALLEGVTSKVLAADLKLSKKTVDFHRSQILRKLGVSTLVQAAVLVCSQQDGGAARDRLRVPRPVR